MNSFVVVAAALVFSTTPALVPRAEARAQSADASPRVPLYRIFLTDGTSSISYGEYARVGEEVVFSMPLGTSPDEPRLHLVTLPASWVDWPRTERYATSVKAQRYFETRAEADYAALSAQITAMMSDMARTSSRLRALGIADDARRLLSAWPSEHYGYRQTDVEEMIALIDEVMSDAGTGAGRGGVQLSLVALPPPVAVEPLLDAPAPREQIAWLVSLANRIGRPAERTALLRAALVVLQDAAPGLPPDDAAAVRRSIESQLREEQSIDQQYARWSGRLLERARRAAERADAAALERLAAGVNREDERLGRLRPEVVAALRAEIDAQIDAARTLRREIEDWRSRLSTYRRYVESVSVTVARLVRARRTLEAIRNGDTTTPGRLMDVRERLAGGALVLQEIAAPVRLRAAHDMLIASWQFAEHALAGAYDGTAAGDQEALRTAAASASGSLMLLAQAQEAVSAALEPPTLR